MLRKGAILSFDALLALALIAVAFGSVLVFANHGAEYSKQPQLEALAHDYLNAKYVLGQTLSESDFNSLTGKTVTETNPVSPLTGHASLHKYPAQCGCTTTCYLTAAVNDSCLGAQDNETDYQYNAWVTP